MKYVTIFKLAPGTDKARKALEVFGKVGVPDGTEATWAAADGKTFITVVETDNPDMTVASTYAPFFEETTIFPVVPLDDAWLESQRAAELNWG